MDNNSRDSSWFLPNVESTIQLGKALIQNIPTLKLLLLEGSIGAGKTTLVKGIGEGLNITEPITSPTFALSQHYSNGENSLVHLDLYRIENSNQADQLFLQEEEEALAIKALIVIEWPERLGINLKDAWTLTITYLPNGGRFAELNPPEKEI